MAKLLTDEEREKIRGAAETAASVLQRLRVERAELDAKIARFENVVQVYEEAIGRRPRPAVADSGEQSEPLRIRRHRKGEAASHIDTILSGGGDYDSRELREAINSQFGVRYPRTTLLAVLFRGRESGKYEQKELRWRMKAT